MKAMAKDKKIQYRSYLFAKGLMMKKKFYWFCQCNRTFFTVTDGIDK
jgi:hypothetical protein